MVLNASGQYVDQVSLFSGNTWSANMVTDNPGTWLIHCHVSRPLQSLALNTKLVLEYLRPSNHVLAASCRGTTFVENVSEQSCLLASQPSVGSLKHTLHLGP